MNRVYYIHAYIRQYYNIMYCVHNIISYDVWNSMHTGGSDIIYRYTSV